jgi:transposase
MLLRYHAGDKKVWSVVRVPEAADEDRRQLHRELIAVQDERTEHVNRIRGLFDGQGIALPTVTAKCPEELRRCGNKEGGVKSGQRRGGLMVQNGPLQERAPIRKKLLQSSLAPMNTPTRILVNTHAPAEFPGIHLWPSST